MIVVLSYNCDVRSRVFIFRETSKEIYGLIETSLDINYIIN